MFLLLYDLSLEKKNRVVAVQFVSEKEKLFLCCMICLWKKKTLSLLYNLFLKRKNVIIAAQYVLDSVKFYFTT